MGSLSNLYISQSYQSLIHLGNDTSASATQIELQDGIGQGLGIFVNTNGDVSIDGALIVSGTFDIEGRIIVNDDVRINGNLAVSGATSLTGSLVVSNQITASNAFIQNDLNVGGTLFANKVVTLIESSSIIYSSGSNILGDAISDTQTLIGSVIMSGSSSLTGSMGISANLNVVGNISSSTISGIGNVTTFSQSVDARLDIVEATASLYVPFSTSVDSRLDGVEATASFLNTSASLALVTASFDLGTRNLTLNKGNNDTFSLFIPGTLIPSGTVSSSAQINIYDTTNFATFNDAIQTDISQKLFTSSFNAYTQSTNNRLSVIETTYATTASLNNLSQSVSASNFVTNNRLNTLSSFTGSYATTGSNTFIGNEVFSGSVSGLVIPITISAQTASMDCNLGNFFTLTLPSGSSTHLTATNIKAGSTLSLRITQAATGSGGNVGYSTNIKFPQAFPYIATPNNGAIDILSFQSYDTTTLFGVGVNTMI